MKKLRTQEVAKPSESYFIVPLIVHKLCLIHIDFDKYSCERLKTQQFPCYRIIFFCLEESPAEFYIFSISSA